MYQPHMVHACDVESEWSEMFFCTDHRAAYALVEEIEDAGRHRGLNISCEVHQLQDGSMKSVHAFFDGCPSALPGPQPPTDAPQIIQPEYILGVPFENCLFPPDNASRL